MNKLLALSLLLLTSPVWACENFDDCMKNQTGSSWDAPFLKAIAYKLDEISKKLDNKNNCPTPGCKDLV